MLPGIRTPVLRLSSKHLSPLSHLANPCFLLKKKKSLSCLKYYLLVSIESVVLSPPCVVIINIIITITIVITIAGSDPVRALHKLEKCSAIEPQSWPHLPVSNIGNFISSFSHLILLGVLCSKLYIKPCSPLHQFLPTSGSFPSVSSFVSLICATQPHTLNTDVFFPTNTPFNCHEMVLYF